MHDFYVTMHKNQFSKMHAFQFLVVMNDDMAYDLLNIFQGFKMGNLRTVILEHNISVNPFHKRKWLFDGIYYITVPVLISNVYDRIAWKCS